MATASVTRSDDGAWRTRMDSQSDCWYGEAAEEEEAMQLPLFDEAYDLAVEIAHVEELPFAVAHIKAEGLLPGLHSYAQRWNASAWLVGNEGAPVF